MLSSDRRRVSPIANNGLSRSSVQGCRNAVSAALSHAVAERLLRSNVAVSARLPHQSMPTTKTQPTVEQVVALLDQASGSYLSDLLVFIAYTGCRIGEALGARWSDIDLDKGLWLLSRTTTRDSNGHVIVGTRTKTGESRTVT